MLEFAPIADSLRDRILRHYSDAGGQLEGLAGRNTLETNSGFVERRGRPLLAMLEARGFPTLEGLRLVDLGCGFGALACFFAFNGAHVVALDPNNSRFAVGRDVAAEHGLDVTFVRGWMQNTALESAVFDIAVQNNSLCYIVPREDRSAALDETHRILRAGGILVSRNPNRWTTRDQFTGYPFLHLTSPERAVAVARSLGRKRSLVRMTSPYEARRELQHAGFEDIRQAGFTDRKRPQYLKLVAKYHHFTARRPGAHPR